MNKKTGLPCPQEDCDSSDAFSIDSNGWGKCFSCGKNVNPETVEKLMNEENMEIPTRKDEPTNLTELPTVFRAFSARGFTEETIKRYKVGIAPDGRQATYPIFDIDNNHIGNKIRKPGKKFSYEGSTKDAGLFGRHAFEKGSTKAITIVEGQDDALAAFQMQGSKYPVVSVHSSATALRDVRKDFEYLNSFETIVICFDNDEQGSKAAKAVANAGFPLKKVRIMTPRKHKDANDYLLKGDSTEYMKEWWQAPHHKPDGLKIGTDIWDEIVDRKESFTVPYPYEGLNALTYGIRLSEAVVVAADTGVGKTSIMKSIEHSLLTNKELKEKNYGVGFMHFEESNGDTALGLLSVHNNVPYHLPDVERPVEDLRKAYDEILNNDRVVIWDHFGSNSVEAVLDKVRHMHVLGCKYIVIDHLSIIVSDQSGDERKQLDEISTKLKTLAMELNIALICVIHTNRQGQIRGTAGVEQIANIVIRLERNKVEENEWRRNITKITIEKNRFCGYTGPACYLWYNKETGTLTELDPEQVKIFEEGGTLRDTDERF